MSFTIWPPLSPSRRLHPTPFTSSPTHPLHITSTKGLLYCLFHIPPPHSPPQHASFTSSPSHLLHIASTTPPSYHVLHVGGPSPPPSHRLHPAPFVCCLREYLSSVYNICMLCGLRVTAVLIETQRDSSYHTEMKTRDLLCSRRGRVFRPSYERQAVSWTEGLHSEHEALYGLD